MASEVKKWRKLGASDISSGRQPIRVLTAAATRVRIDNQSEVRRQRAVRQNWQLDSFVYRNTIGELRYAVNFLANCAARMRMFIAVLPSDGESDMPIELTEYAEKHVDEVPPELLAACANAIQDLGNGRVALANMNHALSTNISLAGEAFLLGQEDTQTGLQTWSVRSISEIVVMGDELKLREGPIDSVGLLGLIDLDPALTTVSRMWQPDPEWRLLADSPMRAILNECEALLILRRNIRATGRSRLAGRGLLAIPDEVSITVNVDDDADPEADPFMGALADAMLTPITNEGDASAVVPIVIRGPGEHLDKIRLIELSGAFDELAGKTRDELIGVIATGLDLPKEIIMGIADLNHWSAWQVDDNTFRHHVEPHVITISDCWTSGFVRPYLETSNLDPAIVSEWVPRIMMWYDPTELVTHPDRMQNATTLHEALTISDAAFRDVGGFTDEDAPSAEEIEVRMIRTMRNWPANVVMALLHELDPSLAVPAMTGPPALPGIDPAKGATAPPAALVAPSAPDAGGGSNDAPSATRDVPAPSTSPASIDAGPPAIPDGPPAPLTASSILDTMSTSEASVLVRLLREFTMNESIALTASGKEWKPSAQSIRLSKALQKIDYDLRARLTVAANDAMRRHLEKVGGNLRNKVAKNETLRTKIAMTKNEHVLMTLGEDVAKKAGITAAGVVADTWSQLKDQFMQWTKEAQVQALKVAQQLGGLSDKDAQENIDLFANSADKGWGVLEASMNSLAVNLAYAKDPTISTDEAIAQLTPDSLVPTGTVRAALAVSGGTPEGDLGMITTNTGAEVAAIPLGFPVGGIGTGATISGLLSDSGAATTSYEWEHGPSLKPFEPHLNLDGVVFSSFTDPALANNGDFPANQFYLPGDHIGCMCDYTPMWVSSSDVQDAMQAGNVDTSTWPASAFNTPTGIVTPKATSALPKIKATPLTKESATSEMKLSVLSSDVLNASDLDAKQAANAALAKHLGYKDGMNYFDLNGTTIYNDTKNGTLASLQDAKVKTLIKSANEEVLNEAQEDLLLNSKVNDIELQDALAKEVGYKDATQYANMHNATPISDAKFQSLKPYNANKANSFKIDDEELGSSTQHTAGYSQKTIDELDETAQDHGYVNYDEYVNLSNHTAAVAKTKLLNGTAEDIDTLETGAAQNVIDKAIGNATDGKYGTSLARGDHDMVNISTTQYRALHSYTSSSLNINGTLRHVAAGDFDAAKTNAIVQKQIKDLTAAIDAQAPTTEAVTVTRITGFPELEAGDEWVSDTFMSTSLPGGRFGSEGGGKIRLTIHVPPGAKYLDMNQLAGLHSKYPNFQSEKEALFPIHSKFVVENVAKNGNMTIKYIGMEGDNG